jgi:hypothetical protein
MWMDGTGEHHFRESYPGGEAQKSHVFTYMCNININSAMLWKTGHNRSQAKGGHIG